MKTIVTVVKNISSEAHLEIPDGLSEPEIRQHIIDLYNSGEMHVDMNIFQADFESISAKIIKAQAGSSGIILCPRNKSDHYIYKAIADLKDLLIQQNIKGLFI